MASPRCAFDPRGAGGGLEAVTRYVEAFSWHAGIDGFLRAIVRERPLLNVCSGKTPWGDVSLDKYEDADICADWQGPWPLGNDSFGAVFADPPWNSGYKLQVAGFMREALRVAPVAYLMAPWIYGASWAPIGGIWVRQIPGVNNPVLVTRYERL